MFNSSKSTRKFSRAKLAILGIILLLFTSGYFINEYASTMRSDSTVTRPSLTTSATPSTSSTTASQGTSTESTLFTSNTTSSQSTSSTIAQTTSSTSASSTATIYRIPQSVLRTEFQGQGLNSNGISFVASPTKVPYYIITRSPSTDNSGSAIGLLYLDTDVDIADCWGYDSYISTLILVNTTGNIQNLTIYGNILDSYGYMITQSWLNTYVNRSVLESFQFGVNAIPVTGATFSSTGIIDGVRDAGRIVINDYQQLAKTTSPQTGGISILGEALNIFGSLNSERAQSSLIALILLFVAAVAAFELKNTAVRYGVAVGSILFMGFYAVRMITISDFIDFTTLRFPPISRDTYFYILYAGALITSLIWGRVYCGYLCPFGTFSDFLNKISPIKLTNPVQVSIETASCEICDIWFSSI